MKYGEIMHFSHPHKLRCEYVEVPFKCDGCKEVGIGSRFKCSVCDYDLHKHCALPTAATVVHHPFYRKCEFQFMARPPGHLPRYCNACEKDVNGFVYHCRSCGFDLHPCCANLPYVLDAGDLKLYLYRKVGGACHKCGRKGNSWTYRSSCKKYNLHVSCVMEMLLDSWHDIYFGGGGHGSNGTMTKGFMGNNTKIPCIRGAKINHHRSKGKVKRCCELAGLALQFIISAVLGDPTAVIAGVIGSFIPRV
ncbi:uncharacterized protein LOC120276807 [Dioscorea cayenensis subsp. rotundata]|uniref:Uncharacterized protein LOC120276807 n=1 Tax=Dioscorea cayennensis subsp. rotundata TaxID=55577 RepID=A0AB40CK41_DIOCR|nr:uncharacterized protein LOC120276807 [Dioscorea cayenensis subsp. rotundata]XP_039139454.1 uncharacterized protein LOC120276807 [Dioscorea cayenensis subsp. rotundata]